MLTVHKDWQAVVGRPLFVIGGDCHIHNWQQFNPMENGRPHRLNVGMDVMRQGLGYSRKFDVPFVVNGDLLHSKNSLDPVVVSEVHKLFAAAGAQQKIYLNVGNHEMPDKFGSVTTLDWLEGLVNVIPSPRSINLPGVRLHVMPFHGNHKAQWDRFEALASFSNTEPNILIAHFPTNGVDLGGFKLESPVEFADFHPEKFDAVLFNDIHKHQPVGQNGYHLGCTHQNNFGESSYDFGWWLVSFDRNTGVHLQRLKVVAPVFGLVNSMEEVQSWRDAGHFARIKPEAAIQYAMAAQEAPRLTVNTSALPKTIHEYVAYMVKDGKFRPEDAPEIERRALALLHREPFGGGER